MQYLIVKPYKILKAKLGINPVIQNLIWNEIKWQKKNKGNRDKKNGANDSYTIIGRSVVQRKVLVQ